MRQAQAVISVFMVGKLTLTFCIQYPTLTLRRLWHTYTSLVPRRCVFVGSSNDTYIW